MKADFVIPFDPDKDTSEDLTDRILYTLFIKRIKGKKPTITFLGADSGEGKSYTYLKLAERLLHLQGVDIRNCLDDVNVYTPVEYPKKIEKLLFDKELKKVNLIGIHEARDVVNAKDYSSFLARSIADINAQSRTVKRLMIFIVSQFIRDITTDIRFTITYYCKIYRPIGKRARLMIYKLWKDDRDLEKPRLKKYKISGFLVYPDGKYRRFTPDYLEIKMPDKEIRDAFEKSDYAAKATIIKRKIDKLVQELSKDIGVENSKVAAMVSFYAKNQDSLSLIGKRYKRGFKLNPNFRDMHDLSKQEVKDFKEGLDVELKRVGLIQEDDA